MIFLLLIFCLAVPAGMCCLGRTYRHGGVPYGKTKGIRFHSKRAAMSEQAWNYANNLYFNMLFMCGINVGLIAVVLYFCVMRTAPSLLWLLCLVLILVQLVGGFLLPHLFTEMMLRRTFDSEGNMIPDSSEADEEDKGD